MRSGRRPWRSSTASGFRRKSCSHRHRPARIRRRRRAAAITNDHGIAMPALIEARNLSKKYGKYTALDGVNLTIEAGRIVGLIGPNGAGKTSALRAILGLTSYEGHLTVLGREPFRDRTELMTECCFIA